MTAGHGTYHAYTKGSCRCDACRAANSAYHLHRRMERNPENAKLHGIVSTYTNYRCRCEDCVAAKRQDQVERAAKRRGRAPGTPATGPNPAAYRPSRELWTSCARCGVSFVLETKVILAGDRPDCPACHRRLSYRVEGGRLVTEAR